jgi:hypothetical protein
MKTLTLNSFILDMGAETKTVSTCDVLLQMLENRGPGGLSLKEMRERMPIMDKVEKALADDETTVDLEDAEVKVLSGIAESMQWNIVSRDIVALSDDLKALCG